MTFLRNIEQSAYRYTASEQQQDDRTERAHVAARGFGAILDALAEIHDFDVDHVSEAEIRELEAFQSTLELAFTDGMRDRVLTIIRQQHRRTKSAKATTVFGETLRAHGEGSI